jgi:hypothetical protein
MSSERETKELDAYLAQMMEIEIVDCQRKYHALRARIDGLIKNDGWSITGREPVRLERGSRVLVVNMGSLVDG